MSVFLWKKNLTYVSIPKVACTSIKHMFFEIENGRPFQPFKISGQFWHIHNFYRGYAFEDLPHPRIADHRRLTVVRDPFGTHDSFGAHNNARLRAFLDGFGFDYEFASSTDYYEGGKFDDAIKGVLRHYQGILDVMLPGDDGLALCREIRAKSRLPILMLTARGDELDRIIGLEMGADDYLPKPFHPRELLARVRSILRRAPEHPDGDGSVRALKFSGWTLDLGARHLVDEAGVVTPLSSGEFRMLNALAENANRVLSRDQLMDVLAGRDAGPFDRTVDVMISRLRRRLGDDGREPRIIRTLRNEGYVLNGPVEKLL